MLSKITRRVQRRRAALLWAVRRDQFVVEPLEPRRLLAGDGLAASYFNNNSLAGSAALSRVDPTINFDYGSGSPAASIQSDYFSARWTGQIQATATGATTFYTNSDDGARLWVNGQQLVNNWSEHAATINSGTITLTAGTRYDIKMEYYENAHGAIAQLLWSGPGFSQQVIPQTVLYSSATPDTQAPTAPSGLIAASKSDTTVAMAWTGATDNVGVTRYDVYRNNALVGSSQSTSYTDSGLTASTAYSYYVKASDAANNISVASATLAVTTVAAAPPGSGNGLLGTYFDNNDLTNQRLTRTDSTINFNWAGGSPDASIGVDTFSARWTGQIQAKYSETYTFTLNSDDGSRLTINNQMVVNSWSEHSARDDSGTIALVAGQKYNITVEYFENSFDATMSLSWASASQPKQTVPQAYLYSSTTNNSDTTPPTSPSLLALSSKSTSTIAMKWNAAADNVGVTAYDIYRGGTKINSVAGSALTYTDTNLNSGSSYTYTVVARDAAGNSSPASNALTVITDSSGASGNGTGLTAQYFDNADLTNLKVTRTDASVNFDWGNGSPDPTIGVDTFSARWTGQVLAKYSESYTFYTYSDDGVRLSVNGKQIINNWTDHGPTENSGTITLTAGQKYNITMEYYESGYGAVAQLSWSSSTQGKQIVPQAYLYPTTSSGPTAPNLPGNWNIAFNDDFNTLNTSVWGNRYWWDGDKGSEVTFKPGNVAVSNGVLTITAKKETATAWDGTVTQYTSGLLTTGGIKGKTPAGFTFTYGYMESRVKFTNGQGLWPSFWSLPASYDDYQGELDTMEIVSARPTIHEMHYHYHGTEAAGAQWNAGIPLGDDYHVYAMDWEPDHISWYVDGVEHFRYTNPATIVNQPFYFILNYDAGGPWAGSPNSTTPFPAQMNVDYVRLWQHP